MDSSLNERGGKSAIGGRRLNAAAFRIPWLVSALCTIVVSAAQAGHLYVANPGTATAPDPSILVFDVNSNQVIRALGPEPVPGGAPRELLVLNGFLYVTTGAGELLQYKIYPTTGLIRLNRRFPVGMLPAGIATDGTSLFVANSGSGTVSMFAIGGGTSGNLKLVKTVTVGSAPTYLTVAGSRKDILFVGNGAGCSLRINNRQSTLTPLSCQGTGAPNVVVPPGRVIVARKLVYSLASGVVNVPPPQSLTAVKALKVDDATGVWSLVGNELSFGNTPLFALAASELRNALFVARQGGIAVVPLASATQFGPINTTLPLVANAGGLTTDSTGGFLYATDPSQGRLVAMRINVGGGLTLMNAVQGFAGSTFPSAIVFGP